MFKTLKFLKPSDTYLIRLLRLGVFCCLGGWAWVHYYWSSPMSILFWQDGTYELAESWGFDWDSFVGTGANDGFVDKIIGYITWFFMAATIAATFVWKSNWWQNSLLLMACGLITLLSYALYVKSQHQLPMFVEHGGQMLMPVVLLFALRYGPHHRTTIYTAVIACMMTFIGHGLYALNIWPTPGKFFAMTSVILGTEYELTFWFLRIAGILDLLICIGFFFRKLRIPCALYAVLWGFATALARPVAGMSTELYYWGADQFLHEFVLRAPHFILPLYLAFVWYRSWLEEKSSEPSSQEKLEQESQIPAT